MAVGRKSLFCQTLHQDLFGLNLSRVDENVRSPDIFLVSVGVLSNFYIMKAPCRELPDMPEQARD